jgi:Uma2 family endonuclease
MKNPSGFDHSSIALVSRHSGDKIAFVQQTAPIHRFSPEEYVELEDKSEVKLEYFQGEIFSRHEGTPEHSLIAANLIGEIGNAVRERDCCVYTSDLKIKVEATGFITHADIPILCGAPRYVDPKGECLANPTVVIEVLSPSTEAYDRGAKFEQYRAIPSLAAYLLVAEDGPRVEQFIRKTDTDWDYRITHGIESVLEISPMGVKVPLREIFTGVTFRTSDGRGPLQTRRAISD